MRKQPKDIVLGARETSLKMKEKLVGFIGLIVLIYSLEFLYCLLMGIDFHFF